MTNEQIQHEIGPEGLFVLRIRDGTARLRAIDGGTATVSADIALGDNFTIERGEGSLAVKAVNGLGHLFGRTRSPSRWDVDVPRRATIVVESASGDLESDGLTGDQRYKTVSGDVRIGAAAGTITVDGVSGDIRLTATGALDLNGRTVSGDIEVRAGRLSRLAAVTTSGDIRVAGAPDRSGTHRLETVSGDMLLALAGGVRVETSTIAGDVRTQLPHRSEGGRGRRVVILGDGAATVTTRSLSGSVRIVEPTTLDETELGGEALVPAASTAPEPPEPLDPPDAPDLPGDADTGPDPATSGAAEASRAAIAAAYEDERLRILRSLERGEIDVSEAGRRLERLDAGDLAEVIR